MAEEIVQPTIDGSVQDGTPPPPGDGTPDPPSKALWQKLYDAKAYTNSFEDFQKKYATQQDIDELHQKLQSAKAFTNPKEDFYKKYFPSADIPAKRWDIDPLNPDVVIKNLPAKSPETPPIKKDMPPTLVVQDPKLKKEADEATYKSDDPKGSKLNSLLYQQSAILNQNLKSDNLHLPTSIVQKDANGKLKVVFRGEEKLNDLGNQIAEIKKSAPTVQEAKAYLQQRLLQKSVPVQKKSDVMLSPDKTTNAADGNIDDFTLSSIQQGLDPRNQTDQTAFNVLKKEDDLNNALSHSANLFEAAVKFQANQNPQLKGQIKSLENSGMHLPGAYEGSIVADFLNNPEIIQKAKSDPEFKKQYILAVQNLNIAYPEYAKKRVSSIISQAREDRGMNNPVLNIPSKESTDELVNELIKDGKLQESDRSVYEKQIAPQLGVMQSVKRGIGRILPFVQTGIDESPIATPGAFENLENSYVGALKGTAHSIEDVAALPTLGAVKINSDEDRLQQSLKSDAEAININPHSAANYFGQTTGHLTGSMIPLIVGGIAGKVIEAPAAIAEAANMGMAFGGNNRDQAMKMFPGEPTKQLLYTAAATGGDMFLGKLLPIGKAAEGITNALKTDIAKVVTDFTEEKITAEAAKKTLLEKGSEILNKSLKIGEANLHTASVITAFTMYHDAIDQAFGGRDISSGEAGLHAVESFTSALIGSTGLSVMAENGGDPKLNGKLIMGMTENPEKWTKVINDEAILHPELAAGVQDKLQNLTDAVVINTDLKKTELTPAQKEKYLLQALSQKIWERKAEGVTDDVIKKSYLEKAKENQLAKEKILSGEDKAPEHQTYNVQAMADKLKQGLAAEQVAKPEEQVPVEESRDQLLEKAKTEIPNIKVDVLRKPFEQDLEGGLKAVAQQVNNDDDDSAKKLAEETYGPVITDIARKLFPEEKAPVKTEVTPANELPGKDSGLTEIEHKEVVRQMMPIAEKLAASELVFENNGFEISHDYDNEIIVSSKKTGDIVEPEDLPAHVQKAAAQYEATVAKMGDTDERAFAEAMKEARKKVRGEDAEFEVVPNESANKKEIPTISEHNVQGGDKITANINGKIEEGTVTNVGKHKGKIVIDFLDKNGNDRFVYGHQIVDIKSGKELPAPEEDKPETFAELAERKLKGKVDFAAKLKEMAQSSAIAINKFLKKKRITLEEFKKLPAAKQKKLNDEWRNSAEYRMEFPKELKKRAKPTIKDPVMLAALKVEAETPEVIVAQHFIGGSGIGKAGIEKLFGRKGTKSIAGELRAKIQLISKDGKDIDGLAHELWDHASEHVQELYTSMDFRQAIEDVLSTHNSRKQIASDLVNRYVEKDQFKPEDHKEDVHPEIKETHDMLSGLTDIEVEKLMGDENSPEFIDAWHKMEEAYQNIQPTPEEEEIAKKEINTELANQIITGEGLTLENLEQAKHLFNGFPFEPEDFESVKELLNERQQQTASEPIEGGQANSGNVDDQKPDSEGPDQKGKEHDSGSESRKSQIAKTEGEIALLQKEFDTAIRNLKSAQEKIAKAQGTQKDMFRGTEKGLFAPEADEVKQILDPLKDKVKEAEAALNKAKSKGVTDTAQQSIFSNRSMNPSDVEEVKAAPIEDYGEKIGGAKKDIVKSLGEITTDDITSQPLSKSFPEPDYKKLVDDGIVSERGAMLMKFLYDNIPSKPRKPYLVKSWAKKVENGINLIKWVVEGKDESLITKVLEADGAGTLLNEKLNIHAAVMKELGFPNKPVNLGPYEVKKWYDRGTYGIVKGHLIVKDFPTLDEAAAGLKQLLESHKAAEKKVSFSVYQDRKTLDFFIGKKGANNVIRLMEGFGSAKEAHTFLKGNQSQLEEMWTGIKVTPEERRDSNRERIGVDYRNGKDVSPEDIAKAFGFRGIEFGNWVNNRERQDSINEAYDALMDMATALGIPAKAVSLNGQLALAFGSRGSGKAMAHYEPDKVVINLTKKKGAGSLGHEWWHAMDNYFSKARGDKFEYVTNKPYQKLRPDGSKDTSIRPEVLSAFKDLMNAIKKSDLAKRSLKLDNTRSKLYWSTDIEMSARSFENFLINRLAETGERNDYLANFKETSEWLNQAGLNLDNYPYPLKEESPAIDDAFKALFKTMETKEGDNGNIVLHDNSTEYDVNTLEDRGGKGKSNQIALNFDAPTKHETEISNHEGKSEAVQFESAASNGDYPIDTNVQPEKGSKEVPGGEADHNIKTISEVWSQDKNIQFTGTTRVKNAADVAHIMRLLENKAVEHMFITYVDKDGNSHIQFVSIGGITGTVADPRLVLSGVKKFEAVKVYLTHNHPSGNLKPSQQDLVLTTKFRTLLKPLGVSLEHVIMDTYKEEYTLINYDDDVIENIQRETPKENDVPLTTHLLDGFEALTKPLSDKPITGSADVAKTLYNMRFAATPKAGMLILDNSNRILGNYIFKDNFNPKEALENFSGTAVGAAVIMYGNQPLSGGISMDMLALRDAFSHGDIKLLDYINVKGGGKDVQGAYDSAADEGYLHDTQEKYGTNKLSDEGGDNSKLIDDAIDLVKRLQKQGVPANKIVEAGVSHLEENWNDKALGKFDQKFWKDTFNESIDNNSTKEQIAQNAVTIPFVKELVKHDILPIATKLGLTVKDTLRRIVNTLSPTTGVAEPAVTQLMKALGTRNESIQAVDKVLGSFEKMFNKMKDPERIDFIDRMKTGQKQISPEMQDISDTLSGLDRDLYEEVLKHKPSMPWKENHYRVLWKTIPGATKEKIWSNLTRRPLQGSRGFMKKATLSDMSEGIARGGVPQSTNPITMFKLSYADAMKFITARRMFDGLKDDGFIKFVKQFHDAPEGFVKINDSIGNVYFKADEGLVNTGSYYIEEGAGRMLNNHLSRDYIRETMLGKGAMEIKNLFTQVELGLSAFHAIAEGLETVSSDIAIGLRKLINIGFTGDFKTAGQGIMDILKSPFSVKTTFTAGRNAIKLASVKDFENSDFGKAYLKKTPAAQEYIHDFFMGGGIMKQHDDLKANTFNALKEHAGKDNYIGAAIRALPAMNETIMNPLFNHYIPALKVGMFMKEWPVTLRENQSRLARGIVTREQLARKSVAFIDDRLGEMNFDNLFWDRTFKTATQFMFRSVTWKLGNLRGMLGAPIEQAKEFLDAAKEKRAPLLTPKMAWLFGLTSMTVALSATIQKMFTGKDLKDLKDVIAPQINSDDPNERVVVPTYWKDMMHLHHSIKQYITSSMSGPVSRMADIWNNKDFYNYEIHDENDSWIQKRKDDLLYWIPKPFSISSAKQMIDKHEPLQKVAMSFFGLNKAPGYLTHTQIENDIFDLYNIRNTSVKPQSVKEGAELKKKIRDLYKYDKKEEAHDLAIKSIKEGILKPAQIRFLFHHLNKSDDPTLYFFRGLPQSDKEHLYNKMTDEEKKHYDPKGTLKKRR